MVFLQGSVAKRTLTYPNTWAKSDPISHLPYRLRQKIPTSKIPSCSDIRHSFHIQNSRGNSVAHDERHFPQSLDPSSSPLQRKARCTLFKCSYTLINKTDRQRRQTPPHGFRKLVRRQHDSQSLWNSVPLTNSASCFGPLCFKTCQAIYRLL